MSNKRSQYVSLSLKKIRNCMQAKPKNVNVTRLAKELNIARTTLNNLRKSKEKIVSKFEARRNVERKRKR